MPVVINLIDLIQKKLRHIQRQTLRETGLTPPQYFILRLLWDADGRPFKALAAAGGYSRATITGIVDTLEGKGLVIRQPNPDDRRSLLVVLTGEGRALQHSTPSLERMYGSCCSGLDVDDIRQLAHLLQKLDDGLAF